MKKSCICSVFKLFEIRLSWMKVDADYFKLLPFLVAKKLIIRQSFLYCHFVFLWKPRSSSNISANKWFGNACQSRWPQISSVCVCVCATNFCYLLETFSGINMDLAGTIGPHGGQRLVLMQQNGISDILDSVRAMVWLEVRLRLGLGRNCLR